jgi:predicted alpha/beta hydrolase
MPNQSLAFILSDAGYDVWLGNMRGNAYSRDHAKMLVTNSTFWAFSFDQMAKQDLGAMVDYTLNKGKQKSLYYVGHSQGTLTMFLKLSHDKEFAEKVSKLAAGLHNICG